VAWIERKDEAASAPAIAKTNAPNQMTVRISAASRSAALRSVLASELGR
jgi:hypothetical protein